MHSRYSSNFYGSHKYFVQNKFQKIISLLSSHNIHNDLQKIFYRFSLNTSTLAALDDGVRKNIFENTFKYFGISPASYNENLNSIYMLGILLWCVACFFKIFFFFLRDAFCKWTWKWKLMNKNILTHKKVFFAQKEKTTNKWIPHV